MTEYENLIKSFFCLEALKLPLQSTFLCTQHGRNSKLTVNNVIKVLEEVNWKRLMKTSKLLNRGVTEPLVTGKAVSRVAAKNAECGITNA